MDNSARLREWLRFPTPVDSHGRTVYGRPVGNLIVYAPQSEKSGIPAALPSIDEADPFVTTRAAIGLVEIPRNAYVSFLLNEENKEACDLDFLAAFEPTDLQSLILSGTRVSNSSLANIRHLTGLRKLNRPGFDGDSRR